VSGAAFAPTTSFRQVTNTGNHIKLEAKFSTAVLLDNRDTIYFECAVRKCTAINDPCCLDVSFVPLMCFVYKNNTGMLIMPIVIVLKRKPKE
jgi:hypothetical protein